MAKFNDIRNIRVLAFLDAYERQECLWNPNLDSYKNKADRDGAYMEIIKELNIPSLTVHDVKQKVKGIRTTYTKELRLLDKHKDQGKPYQPKLFWFHKANAFLKHVSSSRHRKTMFLKQEEIPHRNDFKECTIEYISDVGSVDEMADGETPDEHQSNEASPRGSPVDYKTIVHVVDQANATAQNQHISQKPDQEPEPMVTEQPSYPESSPAETPTRSITRNESTQATDNTTATCKGDEFDLFCRSVAAQLRSIPDSYSRSVAKLKIQQILFEAETGHYKHNPCITIPIVQQVNNI